MAITAFVGLQGSGKSYSAVSEVILPALHDGRKVFTNIPLVPDKLPPGTQELAQQFEMQEVLDNPDWFDDVFEPGSIILLDELWRLWPSGLKANNALDQHKEFLSMHRHKVGSNGKSSEIYFLTQDLSQIANFARVLVDKTYRTTKLDLVGKSNRYRVDIFQGPITGPNPPLSKRLREIYGAYKPEIYQCYKSHTESQTGEAGDESRTDTRFNVLKGWGVKTSVIALIASIIIVPVAGSYIFGKMFGREVHNSQVSSPPRISSSPEKLQTESTPQRKVPKYHGLLDKADIYISFNNGVFPNTDFRFSVHRGLDQFSIKPASLISLGYRVTAINKCLVRIVGSDFNGYISCRSEDVNDSLINIKPLTGG
ncbi:MULTISPECIES: zonular occludens toxin domain-containing protein [unclassified Microbulbifer]|uniref:zonular occludens toxin domain-containing protein n=1 Tax=unclassified Microbulbifer TaxID=2619833 RepID=UPI0027E3E349|nr:MULTISPECIES: zonular occludens toxin domain-containing protein [unclassified Microbulbifer]